MILCGSVGRVVKAEIKRFPDTFRSKGWGIAEYANVYDAIAAVERLNMAEYNGRVIHVRFDRAAVDEIHDIDGIRVFVGNIPWDVSENELLYHFRLFTPARLRLMTNMSGRSRGFAILQYSTREDAERAILALNNSIIMGREIQCRIDRGPGREVWKPAVVVDLSTSLYVKNLHPGCTEDVLISIFAPFGRLSNVKVMIHSSGVPKGWGTVSYFRYEDALRALESLNGHFALPGMPAIEIRLDRKQNS